MIEKQYKLPFSKWFFIFIGILTFYLPLVYLIMAIWALGGMIFNYNLEIPAWLMGIGTLACYLTVALLPIYITWVIFSKQLTAREKLWWAFIVILINCFRILFTNSQHKLLIDFIKAEKKL